MTELIEQKNKFAHITGQIETLICQAKAEQITPLVNEYTSANNHQGENLLLQGLIHFLHNDMAGAMQAFNQARNSLDESECPDPSSIYSRAYIQGQLCLPQRRRTTAENGHRNFTKNLAALEQVDSMLAREVQDSPWPQNLILVDFWSDLHLFHAPKNKLMALENNIKTQLENVVSQRIPIAFGGIISGQELKFCLDHQHYGLLGMTRPHYLFEPDTGLIKALLHLYDLTHFLATQELIILGGSVLEERSRHIFGSMRYIIPNVMVGNAAAIQDYISRSNPNLQNPDLPDQVTAYYASDDFRRRQKQIMAGTLQPRILVVTCRWTTFLKHCAADFQKAFEQLGCQTGYLIEENNVQSITDRLRWSQLNEFKPDALFMVSHARPSVPNLPPELPFIAFIQDRCGTLWTLPDTDLRQHIACHDLLICLVEEFQNYLSARKIPQRQMMIMPVPADENMFYPLKNDHYMYEKFTCDVSYVKHGNADTDAVMQGWMTSNELTDTRDPQKIPFAKFFTDLYHTFMSDLSRRWPENILHELIDKEFGDLIEPQDSHLLHQNMTSFAVEVYTACRRRYYLEGLKEAELDLKLYGNSWRDDRLFKPFAGGNVNRDTQLNAVYNFTRINLHLQPYITMHQRLVECALAGGFIMVSDIPPEQDWGPARNYFAPDEEIVFFDSREDLIDKCRYYLEHEKERLRIAENMRNRALRERTCLASAKTVLEKWRSLLREVTDYHPDIGNNVNP
ncbi:MAG: glycosyltransferase [Sedimentisphaerales bacterium]|nr:glycosyltransferase [Sedimentisphaerales bacterium]